MYTANRRGAVIKLKQVEHVRNERNVLAAVAGHPFITTMIASFQDYDSLYMLVRQHVPTVQPRTDRRSSTIVLAERSLAT